MSSFNTYNNNQNQNKSPDVTVYSGYRMNNAESKIDQTCVTFRYWKSNLCISICPRKQTGNDEVQFDMDNCITIYLSHTKARIFAEEIKKFLAAPESYKSVGVPSGQAIITLSNGVEYGKNTPVLVIRKLNDGGEVSSEFAYEFKTDFHYSVENYIGTGDFTNNYEDYKYIEIQQLVTLLEEYYKSATNAVAFTVMDQRKYSSTRMENKIDAIAAALNVEVKGGSNNNGRRFNSNSHFSSSNSSEDEGNYHSYSTATLDDLD